MMKSHYIIIVLMSSAVGMIAASSSRQINILTDEEAVAWQQQCIKMHPEISNQLREKFELMPDEGAEQALEFSPDDALIIKEMEQYPALTRTIKKLIVHEGFTYGCSCWPPLHACLWDGVEELYLQWDIIRPLCLSDMLDEGFDFVANPRLPRFIQNLEGLKKLFLNNDPALISVSNQFKFPQSLEAIYIKGEFTHVKPPAWMDLFFDTIALESPEIFGLERWQTWVQEGDYWKHIFFWKMPEDVNQDKQELEAV